MCLQVCSTSVKFGYRVRTDCIGRLATFGPCTLVNNIAKTTSWALIYDFLGELVEPSIVIINSFCFALKYMYTTGCYLSARVRGHHACGRCWRRA